MNVDERPPKLTALIGHDLRSICDDFFDDNATFITKYGATKYELVERLREMHGELRNNAHVKPCGMRQIGSLGFAALVGSAILESARLADEGGTSSEEFQAEMNYLFAFSSVRAIFRRYYAPSEGAPDHVIRDWFHAIRWTQLSFLRCGTTSMLFKGLLEGKSEVPIAVKVVHSKFQQLLAVGSTTRNYMEVMREPVRDCPNLATVYSSWSGFIIEEYIPGLTLGEWIEQQATLTVKRNLSDRLNVLGEIMLPLLSALDDLHSSSIGVHADLSPSNVILQEGGNVPVSLAKRGQTVIMLIYVGRKYFASETIGQMRSPEAHFVAPEVIRLPPRQSPISKLADFYSVGLFIPCIFGSAHPSELASGRIPDELFEISPLLARLAIDLTDPIPHQRLSVVRFDLGTNAHSARDLARYLEDLIAGLNTVEDMLLEATGTTALARGTINPTSLPLLSFGRSAARLRRSSFRIASTMRFLALWQVLAVLTLVLCIFAVGVTTLYALGNGVSNFAFVSRAVKSTLHFTGFPAGTAAERNQAKIVGVSFAFAAFYYYRVVFSQVSLWRSPGRPLLRVGSEISARLSAVIALPLVLAGNLKWPSLWLWFSTIGVLIVGLNNTLTYYRQKEVAAEIRAYYAEADLDDAANRSIVKLLDSAGAFTVSEGLAAWAPSLLLYGALLMTLALIQGAGWAHDLWVYAVGIAVINAVFFTWAQAIRQGGKIRLSLARTAAFGERISFRSTGGIG
jgi:serine/threonine protein kinase